MKDNTIQIPQTLVENNFYIMANKQGNWTYKTGHKIFINLGKLNTTV